MSERIIHALPYLVTRFYACEKDLLSGDADSFARALSRLSTPGSIEDHPKGLALLLLATTMKSLDSSSDSFNQFLLKPPPRVKKMFHVEQRGENVLRGTKMIFCEKQTARRHKNFLSGTCHAVWQNDLLKETPIKYVISCETLPDRLRWRYGSTPPKPLPGRFLRSDAFSRVSCALGNFCIIGINQRFLNKTFFFVSLGLRVELLN